MKIKELIRRDSGFQYVIESIECMSAAGRRKLLDGEFMSDAAALEDEWQRLSKAVDVVGQQAEQRAYIDLRHCLMQLHDLNTTLSALATHTVLNEVDLFEIKNLAYLTGKAHSALTLLSMSEVLPLPELDEVFHTLDPDGTGVVNFYIYDSYDPRLPALRHELKALQEHEGDPQRISDLLAEQNNIQQAVCQQLSNQLATYYDSLSTAMEQMAYADSLFAKAHLVEQWRLQRPTIGSHTAYQQLFNPRLRDRNEQLGLRYQPVDIDITPGVTLITGANMAGKTVLLKSLSIAQMMAQCGLFVPAAEATVTLVEDVATSIGDEQDEMNGLSSYASEIIKISDIVKRSRSQKLLVLIDEPARTTNPVEGKALVQSIITILQQATSTTLITTHYSQLGTDCRRLRVKGFVENMADVPLTPESINRFIDYSLTDDLSDDVPHEALRIAAILECDSEMIENAKQMLSTI